MDNQPLQPTEPAPLDCYCPGYTWDGQPKEPGAPTMAGCPYHDALDADMAVRDLGATPFPEGLGPDIDHGPHEQTVYDVERQLHDRELDRPTGECRTCALPIHRVSLPGEPETWRTPTLGVMAGKTVRVHWVHDHTMVAGCVLPADEPIALPLRAVSGESANPAPAGDTPAATVRATDQVPAAAEALARAQDLPVGQLRSGGPYSDSPENPVRLDLPLHPGAGLAAAISRAQAASPHWSDSPDAALIRRIFRRLPPVTWDVSAWTPAPDDGSVSSTIDTADAHRMIAAILNAAHVESQRDKPEHYTGVGVGALHHADANLTTVDPRPHSRACGVRQHSHGPACHSNCPTCGGRQFA